MTITGTILDATGNGVSALVAFESLSTPLVLANGLVIADSAFYIRCHSDGTFSVNLEPGNYLVVVSASQKIEQCSFNISVPNSGGPYTIDQITTTSLTYTYTAPPSQLVDAGVVFNPNANFRFTAGGQLQLWDSAAYTADNTKPWRAIGCVNGALTLSDPIAN